MRPIELLRNATRYDVLSDVELSIAFGNGTKRHSLVKRMFERGELKRVKRGLYLFGDAYRRSPVPLEYLSNVIYGPSYVSLESGLAYHGLIPEAVVNVTAVNPMRTYRVRSPLAEFLYRKIPQSAFGHDVLREETGAMSFLIGSPEKCILDKLYLDCSTESPIEFLFENMRVDEEKFRHLNKRRLRALTVWYRSEPLAEKVSVILKELKHGRG